MTALRLDGDATLRAPADAVWSALGDRLLVGRLIPATQALQPTGPGTFAGTLVLGTPPLAQRHPAEARVERHGDTLSVNVQGTGRSAALQLRLSCTIRPSATPGVTLLHYALEGQVGPVTERLGGGAARAMVADFLKALQEELSPKTPSGR